MCLQHLYAFTRKFLSFFYHRLKISAPFGQEFCTQTLFSFSLLLTSVGVTLMEEWTVLYRFTSSSKTSMYFLVEFAEKYLNIFSFMVVFQRSTTLDFSSFSVE